MERKTISLVPALTLIALLVIGHLPLGLPEGANFIVPSLILSLIFTWSLKDPGSVPPWFVFTLGILADVLSSGPIGYWPLYYLVCQAIAFWLARGPSDFSLFPSWVGFLLAVTITTLLGWGVATAYFMRAVDWQPMAIGALVVWLAYPVIFRLSGSGAGRSRSGLIKMSGRGS